MIENEKATYLLDTNIISEIVTPKPDFKVIEKIVMHSSDMAISSITVGELFNGIYLLPDSRRKTELLEYTEKDVLENFPVKEFGVKAAEIFGKLNASMVKNGHPLAKDDLMIASIAISESMILVTRNEKHFKLIEDFFPLKVENWFEN